MVRLEGDRGPIYIDPASVLDITPSPSRLVAQSIVRLKVGDIYHVVKGTPDEVHAALFPAKNSP